MNMRETKGKADFKGRNFKVGDKVKINPIYTHNYAVTNERMLEGVIVRISNEMYAQVKINKYDFESEETAEKFNWIMGSIYPIRTEELIHIGEKNLASHNQEQSIINIRPSGKNTLATLSREGKIISSAIASCCDEDEFEYATGAVIAFARLFGEKEFFTMVDNYKSEYENSNTNNRESVNKVVNKVNVFNSKIGKSCGVLGHITKFRDCNGKKLCIGDMVDIYDKELRKVSENAVVINYEGKDVVCGIGKHCQANGNISKYRVVFRSSLSNIKLPYETHYGNFTIVK